MTAIYGRHVAIRMAIVGAIVLAACLIAAVAYHDLQFVFDGAVGVLGCGISSVVALRGQHLRTVQVRDDRADGGPASRQD